MFTRHKQRGIRGVGRVTPAIATFDVAAGPKTFWPGIRVTRPAKTDRNGSGIAGKNSGANMMTAEQNYCLLQEFESDRRFLLMAYQQNPRLLESAEMRIRQLFEMPAHDVDNSLSSVLRPQSAPRPPEGRASGGVPLAGASERGISLIELIMFIIIVSVALAGILLVMNVTTKGSADPLIRKQALAAAESLIEEIELMPFTFCDPDDPTADTAASTGACTVRIEGLGPDAAFAPYQTTIETRYSLTTPFDNVNDYSGFHMTPAGGIQDINNNTVLTGYDALVTMTQPGLGTIAGTETLLINVTVFGPDNVPITLEGFRTRYAPRTTP